MSDAKIEKPKHQDWKETSKFIWHAKGLKTRAKVSAWLHGFIDGIKGLVKIDDSGTIRGPYSTQMVELANESISTEWKNCGRDMEAFVPYLEQQQARFDELKAERLALCQEREKAEAHARSIVYEGDAKVSESALQRRKSWRIRKAAQFASSKIDSIDEEMRVLREESAEALNDYYARERISIRNEECLRCESAQKFAIYARAACGLFSRVRNKAGIRDVASVPLTCIPSESHFEKYRRYGFELVTETI